MADKLDATFHGGPRKVKIFFHVYQDELHPEKGEYIEYEDTWQNGTELNLFVDKVWEDIQQRIVLLARRKSMLTPDLEEG